MVKITDPYVKKNVGKIYKKGVEPCVVGVYQILVGLVGLTGVALTWIARLALKRSPKPYQEAKKRSLIAPVKCPLFIGQAEHPHRTRTDKQLPQWRPIETPSTLQRRDGGL